MSSVWFLHHYATVPYRNGYVRPFRFATQLKKAGIRTTIFCSSYHHWSDENVITEGELYKKEIVDEVDFLYVKTPSSATGVIARIKNMFLFAKRVQQVAKEYLKTEELPEVIIASSPHPLTMIAGIKIAKRYKIPCICEIRDLWPEAIFYGSKVTEKSLIGRLLMRGERWIYKHADALIFTKEGDTDYLKERAWTTDQGGDIDLAKCFYINNGVDYNLYQRNIVENVIEDKDIEDESFKIIYAGAIRPVNNVENIIEAAKLLSGEKEIKFLIYGDGNQRATLEQRVKNEKINNVIFKGYVENRYLAYILSKGSVNLLNYSAQKYNWSRGNSSNKLFEYMASGRPIISTVKTGYSIIQKYNCGIELEDSSPKGLANAIRSLQRMDKGNYEDMCKNAAVAAREFDYENLTKRLLTAIAYVKGKYDK